MNTEFVKEKVFKEKRNVREKTTYKHNVNKAKNKGKKKQPSISEFL